MMRFRYLSLFLLAVTAFGGDSKVPQDLEVKLLSFEQAVVRKEKARIVGLLDEEYKSKEHDALFKENTDLFLNGLLCGKTLDGKFIYCLDFDAITELSRQKVEKTKKGYAVTYRAKTQEKEIVTTLTVTAKPVIIYGLVGSKGLTQVE